MCVHREQCVSYLFGTKTQQAALSRAERACPQTHVRLGRQAHETTSTGRVLCASFTAADRCTRWGCDAWQHNGTCTTVGHLPGAEWTCFECSLRGRVRAGLHGLYHGRSRVRRTAAVWCSWWHPGQLQAADTCRPDNKIVQQACRSPTRQVTGSGNGSACSL